MNKWTMTISIFRNMTSYGRQLDSGTDTRWPVTVMWSTCTLEASPISNRPCLVVWKTKVSKKNREKEGQWIEIQPINTKIGKIVNFVCVLLLNWRIQYWGGNGGNCRKNAEKYVNKRPRKNIKHDKNTD